MTMTLTWTGPASYFVSWSGNGPSDTPPESLSGVPSKPLSPLPTLPDASAESDACAQ